MGHTGNSASIVEFRASDIVAEMQNAIFEHRLPPGTKLSEDEVGEIYGVSRTIVRAALQTLAHSELVTIERNRGAFVARPTIREAQEVFEARGMIEPRVAAMAAKRMGTKELKRLATHLDAEHAANASGDMGRALSLSGGFHVAIAEIADHQVFTSFVRSLISRSSLIIALYWRRPDTTCESHSHHALMTAFANKDGKAAEEIMRSHIVDLHSGLDLKDVEKRETSLATLLASTSDKRPRI
jgi:DNA-binding GntR family transcriptional regulator